MAITVIAEYLSKPGHSEQVAALLLSHWPLLRDEGFTTEQPAFVMRNPKEPDMFLEVFAWKEENGPEAAWENPRVAALWNEIQSHCENEIDPDYYEMIAAHYIGGG